MYTLFFCCTFSFHSKSNTFGHFGILLPHIGVFFLNHLKIDLGVMYSSPSPSFWDRYPFCWIFFWLKEWDFRQFWHISSALLEVFFWMTCQINLRVIAPYFLRFLWSILPTGGQILRSPSFSVSFFLVQKVTFDALLAHFQHMLEDFFWMS